MAGQFPIAAYERRALTGKLAEFLERIVGAHTAAAPRGATARLDSFSDATRFA